MALTARLAIAVTVAAAAAALPAAAAAKPGKLDRRYGTKGAFETKLIDGGSVARLERRGRLLVAGGVYDPGVVRLTRRGNRDRSFRGRGVVRARNVPVTGFPFGIRRLRDRTIRVGSAAATSSGPAMALLRYGPDGERMRHFAHEPYLPGPIGYGTLRPDGGAYLAGGGGAYDGSSSEIRAVAPDGGTDSAFGFGGTVRTEWLGARGAGVLLARRGGVLFVTSRNGRATLVQLLRDGTPDPTFGDGGMVRLPFRASAIHVARGGDLILAGGRGRFFARVIRLSAQGERRRSFGVGGTAGWHRGRFGGTPLDIASDRRGRIYVLFSDDQHPREGILAFTRAGRRLNGFGRRGRAWVPGPPEEYAAHDASDLVVDRGGLLVVGSHHVDGLYHSVFGSGDREDLSAYETRLKVWRFDR